MYFMVASPSGIKNRSIFYKSYATVSRVLTIPEKYQNPGVKSFIRIGVYLLGEHQYTTHFQFNSCIKFSYLWDHV